MRKEREKAERALQTAERRRLAAEKKIQHASDVQAQKELRIAQKAAKNTTKLERIPPTKVNKRVRKPKESVAVAQSSRVEITTSRGRTTMRTVQG